MRITFVGSNPSQSSAVVTPFFEDTVSSRILKSWVARLLPEQHWIYYLNVANYTTHNNRPLNSAEIKAALPQLREVLDGIFPDRVVALGKTAEKALTLLGCDFYAMPHPSGLNRKLNDPKYVEEKIKGLIEYISPIEKLSNI
jgi:uracil-DNA glycosylase